MSNNVAGSVSVTNTPNLAEPIYFPVSLFKLVVMDLCTLGLYQVYWFYKNWMLIKERERSNIIPALRAIFAVLFCYACFKRIRATGEEHLAMDLAIGPLAAAWIIVTILWKLPDPYWLISFASIVFLLPIQNAVNQVNAKLSPNHNPNRQFSKANIAAIVVGGLVFVLGVIGTFLPEQ